MRRFFVPPEALDGELVTITGPLAHHLGRVLRLSPGEVVQLCAGDGQICEAELTAFDKEAVRGRVIRRIAAAGETSVPVTLYQGLPKGDKLELIIQKCTELGVDRIVPLATSRAVVRLDGAKGEKKRERWQKIAQEASQQAKRVTVPAVTAPLSWREMLAELPQAGLVLVLWEDEETQGLRACLEDRPLPERVSLIVGPEGGLSAEEVAALRAAGAVSVSLGKRILRTETAGLAALAMVLYHTGDLG